MQHVELNISILICSYCIFDLDNIYPNIASILPKFCLNIAKFLLNLTNFAQI